MSKLKELRLRMGLSQPKLAVTAGVHTTTIYKIEAGRSHPSPSIRKKLANALCVKPSDIN